MKAIQMYRRRGVFLTALLLVSLLFSFSSCSGGTSYVGTSDSGSTAADAVIAKINAIGTVAYTDESKAKIDDARAAYDALTEAQKKLVPAKTLALLTAAESAYAELKAAAGTSTGTVTWNNDDITGSGTSFTKEGVTITAGFINFDTKDFVGGGTFTTTLGNFTKIEVIAGSWDASGTGWSGNVWTGNASSVSFSGNIIGNDNIRFVFTIEPTN